MDIQSFFRTLTVNFDRSQLLRQLDETESNIMKIDMSAIAIAQDLIGSKKVKSNAVKEFHKPLHTITKSSDTLVPALAANAKHIPEAIQGIRSAILSSFSEKISASGLSYRQLNLINFVEALDFYSKTTRTYLRWLYDEEALAADSSATRHVVKAEVTQLLSTRAAFGNLIEFFNRYSKNIQSLLDRTVEAIFDENTHTVIQANNGRSKIDPANIFVVGVRYNIFWHIGKFFTELQLQRYKTDIEEKKALELRVLRLKEIQAGQPTTETEKELSFVEEKLKRTKADIAELEIKYGL